MRGTRRIPISRTARPSPSGMFASTLPRFAAGSVSWRPEQLATRGVLGVTRERILFQGRCRAHQAARIEGERSGEPFEARALRGGGVGEEKPRSRAAVPCWIELMLTIDTAALDQVGERRLRQQPGL